MTKQAKKDSPVIEINKFSAWHNDPVLKAMKVAALKADIELDHLQQGYGFWNEDEEIGCNIGCLVRGRNHSDLETQIGFPTSVAILIDILYERQSRDYAPVFAVANIELVEVGASLWQVPFQFVVWVFSDPENGILSFMENEQVIGLIRQAVDIWQRIIADEEVPESEWNSLKFRIQYLCSDLRDLRALLALRALRALLALFELRDLRALSALSAIFELRDLRAVSALRALFELRDLSDLSARRDAQYFLELLQNAPVGEVV